MSKDNYQEELNEENIDEVNNSADESVEQEETSKIKKIGTRIVLGLLIVLTLAFGLNYYINNKKEENLIASKYLQRIIPVFAAGDYAVALNGNPNMNYNGEGLMGLKAIVNKYSGTDSYELACYYTAKALYETKEYSQAEKYFSDATGSDSKFIQLGAYSGLGMVYEELGKKKESAESYEKASELTEYTNIKSKFLYFAAMHYEELGNKEKSIELYKKVTVLNHKFKYDEFGGLARAGLNRLGTKID